MVADCFFQVDIGHKQHTFVDLRKNVKNIFILYQRV